MSSTLISSITHLLILVRIMFFLFFFKLIKLCSLDTYWKYIMIQVIFVWYLVNLLIYLPKSFFCTVIEHVLSYWHFNKLHKSAIFQSKITPIIVGIELLLHSWNFNVIELHKNLTFTLCIRGGGGGTGRRRNLSWNHFVNVIQTLFNKTLWGSLYYFKILFEIN